ncbi:hypothetical protein W97_04319 [Coniosporium apollinis CBS 100218]|uniref:BTB domain-containing protein n=1 Tax=Coniosporium apollinis (strain CBS 100218) TaxID=1168221 RepID=R7YTF5_CONA1|nr:uncharacterized protein W97_04319 [Coniosporium apollinis CBS 100218]EON65084.1 hypothetical protein W97_04319 [Coniosporium apollinis CBS 100218]
MSNSTPNSAKDSATNPSKDSKRVNRNELQLFTELPIKVDVGPSPISFYVHERLLRDASRFFDAAMRGGWKESTERVVLLPVDDPEVFNLFVGWLYNRKFPTKNDVGSAEGNEEYMLLAKLYVLGEKLQATAFKTAVIGAILGKAKTKVQPGGHSVYPAGSVVRYLYENTPPKSPVRRLLVDFYVWYGQGSWLARDATDAGESNEFLVDLAVALLDGRHPPSGSSNPINLAKSGRYCEREETPWENGAAGR